MPGIIFNILLWLMLSNIILVTTAFVKADRRKRHMFVSKLKNCKHVFRGSVKEVYMKEILESIPTQKRRAIFSQWGFRPWFYLFPQRAHRFLTVTMDERATSRSILLPIKE
jgi:hypothetical protein